jgi:hypothetical protein
MLAPIVRAVDRRDLRVPLIRTQGVLRAGLLLAPVFVAASTPISLAPAKFTSVPLGWHAFDDDVGALTRNGGETGSYALSWNYSPRPGGWASVMPRRGIAVQMLLLRRRPDGLRINLCLHTPHLRDSPPIRRLPLRLPATTGSRLEGAPRVLEYRVFGRIGDMYNVDLRVDVNDPHPTRSMLRAARQVVSGLRFPVWPRRRSC